MQSIDIEATVQKGKGKRPSVLIRPAYKEDEAVLRHLLEVCDTYHWVDDLDWSEVYPFWALADLKGEIAGAIQICAGKPIGHLEFLLLDNLSQLDRARVTKALLLNGLQSLKNMGSQVVTGMVPHQEKTYKKMIKNRGGIVVSTGNLMGMKV